MTLRDEFLKTGNWLFRWRSFVPYIFLPTLLIALQQSEYLEQTVGYAAEDFWEGFCVVLSLIGLSIRCIVAGYVPGGTSGRNTKKQKAKTLNTTGIYSIVRHPLYLGNFLIFLGWVLFTQVWWLVLISTLLFWLYYKLIIFAEEEFLRNKFGERFLGWAAKTPAFIPKFENWQPPNLSFSLKNVMRREYTGFFVTITFFTFIDIVGDIFTEGKIEFDLVWIILFAVSLMTYVILRTLKKKTKILNIKGR